MFPSTRPIENNVDLPDSGDADAKTICPPSGVQVSQVNAGNESKRISRSLRSSPPCAGTRMISPAVFPRLRTNATSVPSGDHAGNASAVSSDAS